MSTHFFDSKAGIQQLVALEYFATEIKNGVLTLKPGANFVYYKQNPPERQKGRP